MNIEKRGLVHLATLIRISSPMDVNINRKDNREVVNDSLGRFKGWLKVLIGIHLNYYLVGLHIVGINLLSMTYINKFFSFKSPYANK